MRFEKDKEIHGYLAFRFIKIDKDDFLRHELVIEEFFYETTEALGELMTFLSVQDDQVERIVYNTQDDDFHFVLGDPRRVGRTKLFRTSQESNLQALGIMYRVINTRKLFEVLNDHNFGNQTLKLKITIIDSFLNHPVHVV